MGKTFGKFKFDIGDIIKDDKRDLTIIGMEYRPKTKKKNSKEYVANEKWYKYLCNKCGNEDYLYEDSLVNENKRCGCNACCTPPKKIVHGINDITVTAPWMVKYFKNPKDAERYSKYSNDYADFVCPDCGRESRKMVMNVCANHGLSCICSDGMSYPNKYMYAILSQLDVDFEIEKRFDWSNGRFYDDYIKYNNKTIITEQHGDQHYNSRFHTQFSERRTFEEELENDKLKIELALANGIDYYFVIDCRNSSSDYIKNSIISSGLLEVLDAKVESIDWYKCDLFATSNLVKEVCEYRNSHPNMKNDEIATHYKRSTPTIIRYFDIGKKFGWLNNEAENRVAYLNSINRIQHYEKPIYCETNGIYYRGAHEVSSYLSTDDVIFYPRQIRQAITRGNNYRGYRFKFIDQPQFNQQKLLHPESCIGEAFTA